MAPAYSSHPEIQLLREALFGDAQSAQTPHAAI
jgi:hypothetical protein